ncbi:MAG: flagellar hook-basal body complex protein [Pirellulaceae bacterium]|nr:flagellar hook-basal body complex protein [Pirellulaceae bacterium]MDG2103851.1 flagellar hook-basal body complex protein [Pirellulaceae bacterium]
MPNSLTTGVSGLLAHQRQLDMVANNLANLNTTAYKTQRIVFSDLLYESLAPATNGNGVAIGGTNPIEVGSGVRTAQIGRNFGQGSFNSTGQPLDFALQGDGFFVVSDSNTNYFTRAGSFSLDDGGYLIDPATGYPVMRFGPTGENNLEGPSFQKAGDDRIQIPLGETILGSPTSFVELSGTLNADSLGPAQQVLTSANNFLTGGGVAVNNATLLNDLDTNTSAYAPGDQLVVSGNNADGTTFSINLAVDNTSTLGDVVTSINGAISGAVASLDAEGNLVLTSDDSGPSTVSLSILDDAGNTGGTDFISHTLVATTVGRNGDVLSGQTEINDVRGGLHNLGYEFQKAGPNEWNLQFTLPDSDGTVVDGLIENIEFSDDGTLLSIGGVPNPTKNITLNFDGILEDQSFDVKIDELFQISAPFSMSINQDGIEPGKLVNVMVNSDGLLQGVSSSGQIFELAQMAIALFRNPQGLSASGNSYFEATLNSGTVDLGAAGAAGRGTVRAGQLEGSNVDVAYEFTQLIVAQRGFSANARSITVADEILEELTNIIR